MILKLHTTKRGVIAALCDTELIGLKYKEGEKVLDLTAAFYKGEKKDKKEIIIILKNAYIINAVGKKSIQLLEEGNFTDGSEVQMIHKIPYVQCVVLQNEL